MSKSHLAPERTALSTAFSSDKVSSTLRAMSYEGISWNTIQTGYAFGRAISIASHQGVVAEEFLGTPRFLNQTWMASQQQQSNSEFEK